MHFLLFSHSPTPLFTLLPFPNPNPAIPTPTPALTHLKDSHSSPTCHKIIFGAMALCLFNKVVRSYLPRSPLSFHFCTKKADQELLPLVKSKLQKMNEEYVRLESKFHEEGGASHKKRREEFNRLGRFATLYESLSSVLKNIEDLKKMAEEDPDAKDFVKEEFQRCEEELGTIQEGCIEELKEPVLYDDYDEIRVELRPGVGGAQSSLFVQDIANMYQDYIIGQGWSLKIIEQQKDFNVKEGLKFCSLKVVGQGCYKKMKCESGVHKVIRVPETESKGRVHSSTMSVVVVPHIPFDFVVNDKDIRYEFTRAQGAGGQHVNKTDSACRATHIPTGLAVFIQQQRVQDQNKKRATQILKQRLFQLQFQKNVEQQTHRRKIQIGSGDRSEKIRTYNFPQDRITDHRIGMTLYGIEKMLGGVYLESFIEEYLAKIGKLQREEAINALKN